MWDYDQFWLFSPSVPGASLLFEALQVWLPAQFWWLTFQIVVSFSFGGRTSEAVWASGREMTSTSHGG